MYTEERLYTYLQQFERDFLQTSTRVIDATEGGVRKRGTEVMTFAGAIERYCREGGVEWLTDHGEADWSKREACRESLRKRWEEAGEIVEIAGKTLPLLREVADSLADQQKVNRLIARIDELRVRMNELSDCYELIVQLTQTTELERFHRDRAIAASRAKGTERQRRQVLRDIENVKAIEAAAGEFRALMETVMGVLE